MIVARESAAVELVGAVDAFIEAMIQGRPDGGKIRAGHDAGELHFHLEVSERRHMVAVASVSESGQFEWLGYVDLGGRLLQDATERTEIPE